MTCHWHHHEQWSWWRYYSHFSPRWAHLWSSSTISPQTPYLPLTQSLSLLPWHSIMMVPGRERCSGFYHFYHFNDFLFNLGDIGLGSPFHIRLWFKVLTYHLVDSQETFCQSSTSYCDQWNFIQIGSVSVTAAAGSAWIIWLQILLFKSDILTEWLQYSEKFKFANLGLCANIKYYSLWFNVKSAGL